MVRASQWAVHKCWLSLTQTGGQELFQPGWGLHLDGMMCISQADMMMPTFLQRAVCAARRPQYAASWTFAIQKSLTRAARAVKLGVSA
jgi:hypothetical protein